LQRFAKVLKINDIFNTIHSVTLAQIRNYQQPDQINPNHPLEIPDRRRKCIQPFSPDDPCTGHLVRLVS
jgi:hypothetical protein